MARANLIARRAKPARPRGSRREPEDEALPPAIGARDREAIARSATTAGGSGETVRDLMVARVEPRFAATKTPRAIGWPPDHPRELMQGVHDPFRLRLHPYRLVRRAVSTSAVLISPAHAALRSSRAREP